MTLCIYKELQHDTVCRKLPISVGRHRDFTQSFRRFECFWLFDFKTGHEPVELLPGQLLYFQLISGPAESSLVGSNDGAVVSVSISCHLKPCMRFSLTRLSDNLLPTAFKRLPHIFSYLNNKSTLFYWLHTTFKIHTAHALYISSVFACNTPVSIASSTRIHQAV